MYFSYGDDGYYGPHTYSNIYIHLYINRFNYFKPEPTQEVLPLEYMYVQ